MTIPRVLTAAATVLAVAALLAFALAEHRRHEPPSHQHEVLWSLSR